MCMGCWEKYGSPRIVNDKTKAAIPLILEVYSHHGAGGGLHVLLDDWNLDCVSSRYSWNEETPEQVLAENACLKAFQEMTLDERASALALWDRFFSS